MTTTPLATPIATPVEGLADQLPGQVARPGDPSYADLARPWNVAVPVTPAAVVAVRSADDVVAAVHTAAASGLRVAVQATGHGASPLGPDVLLLATGALDECTVHPEGWARVGAGVSWRRVVDACTPYGLAPLSGSSLDVGVVGYTTGGGLGPMARTFGLASDAVRALEVVTGDGVLRRVTPQSEPDLFWALRGGKATLGVVTAVELDLVRVATPYAGALYFDGTDARAVLQAWRQWSRALPETVTTSVALLQLPPLPDVPPVLAGRLTVAVRYVHVGDHDEAAELLAPLRAVAPVLLDGVGPLPYAQIDRVHADPVDPMPVHETAVLLRELTDATLDAVLGVTGPGSGSPMVVVELRQLGGAVARGGAHPSAVCHRDAACSLLAIGLGVPPFVDAVRATAGSLRSAVDPWSDGHTLPNFGGGPQAYDAPTRARLRGLAERYDPRGLMTDGRLRLDRG